MKDEPFDHLTDMIHRGMDNATAAGSIEERVVVVDIMRAAMTDYLAQHAPDGWSAFGKHMSDVVQWADKQKDNKRRLFE